MFKPGEKIALGASGGKDSTGKNLIFQNIYFYLNVKSKILFLYNIVIAHIMHHLNKKYSYGLNLFLLSVDEGIIGYRDDSLLTVKLNQQTYDLPLKIVSYKDLYGWTMDEVVK